MASAIMSEEDVRELNSTYFDRLESGGAMAKKAADAATDFVRTQVRENSIAELLITFQDLSNAPMDRTLEDRAPQKIYEKEPENPIAIQVPLASTPENYYITGNRFPLRFSRAMTARAQVDVQDLRTTVMDIRQVLSDNSLMDLMIIRDQKFFEAANTYMQGPEVALGYTGGVPMWREIHGGIERETWVEASTTMARGRGRYTHEKVVINNITVHELTKFDRGEMGGDWAEETLQNGWTETQFYGKPLIVTIKTQFVPNNSIYMISAEKFLGKAGYLEQPTMHVRKEAFMVDFFCYMMDGISLVGGVARVDFK